MLSVDVADPTTLLSVSKISERTVALLVVDDSLMTFVATWTVAELALTTGYVTNTPPPATLLAYTASVICSVLVTCMFTLRYRPPWY